MAYTIWDKVFEEHGGGDRSDWNNEAVRAAWNAYDNANQSTRDLNWWEYGDADYSDSQGKNYFNDYDKDTINKINRMKKLDVDISKVGQPDDAASGEFDWDKWKQQENDKDNAYKQLEDLQNQLSGYRTLEGNPDIYQNDVNQRFKNLANDWYDKAKQKVQEGSNDIYNGDLKFKYFKNNNPFQWDYKGSHYTLPFFNSGYNENYDIKNKEDIEKAIISASTGKNYIGDIDSEGHKNWMNFINNSGADPLLWQVYNNSKTMTGGNGDPSKDTENLDKNTKSAWKKLWDEYHKSAQEHGGDYSYADAHFRELPIDEVTRRLINQDIAKNANVENYQDLWDMDKRSNEDFDSWFNAMLTGEGRNKPLAEIDYNDTNYNYDKGSYENGNIKTKGQRYHGQDFLEKLYGRTAQQRLQSGEHGKEDTHNTGDRNMFSTLMQDELGNGNTSINDYLKYTEQDNVHDLTQMLKTSPEKIKKFTGGNTYELNEISKKLVDKFNSPLFREQGDLAKLGALSLSNLMISENALKANKDPKEVREQYGDAGAIKNGDQDNAALNEQMSDYLTGLMNTYLNAADLSQGKNAASAATGNEDVDRINQNVLNQFLNYTENEKYHKDKEGKDNGSDNSYKVFDQDWTYEGTPETGEVDLSALYNIVPSYSQLMKSSKPGLPFNRDLLRKAINKGKKG